MNAPEPRAADHATGGEISGDHIRLPGEIDGCTVTRPVPTRSERRAGRRITAESTVDETATP